MKSYKIMLVLLVLLTITIRDRPLLIPYYVSDTFNSLGSLHKLSHSSS